MRRDFVVRHLYRSRAIHLRGNGDRPSGWNALSGSSPLRSLRSLPDIGKDFGDLLLVQSFFFQQLQDQAIEDVAVINQDFVGFRVGLIDQVPDLFVNDTGDRL